MIDDKKIEAAKEEIYEDRFLLNGEEVVFDNDTKEEMFYKEDIKQAIGLYQEMWEIRVRAYTFTDWIFVDELLDLITKGGNHD